MPPLSRRHRRSRRLPHATSAPISPVPTPAGTPGSSRARVVLTPEKNLCAERSDPVAVGSVQWNGWGRDLFNTRYQPEPAIRAMDVPKLALEVGLRISGRRQRTRPAHLGRRQIVRDEFWPAASTRWTPRAAAPIGPSMRPRAAARRFRSASWASRSGRRYRENLNARSRIWTSSRRRAPRFSATTPAPCMRSTHKRERCCGRRKSTHIPTARIIGAPTLNNDRLYVAVGSNEDSNSANPNYSCCTFRGSVAALDIASGRVLWKSYTVLEEPQPTRKNSAGVQEFGPAGRRHRLLAHHR